jgi:hypothetical protein
MATGLRSDGFWASEVVGRFGCGNFLTYVLPTDVTLDASHSAHMAAADPQDIVGRLYTITFQPGDQAR